MLFLKNQSTQKLIEIRDDLARVWAKNSLKGNCKDMLIAQGALDEVSNVLLYRRYGIKKK